MDASRAAGIKAVVVGVERYDAGSAWNLNGPADDAVRFALHLVEKGVPLGNIRCFLSPLADKQKAFADLDQVPIPCAPATEAALNELFEKQLREEKCDRLVLYWSGHGFMAGNGRERRLFTADATNAVKNHINLNSLLNALGSVNYTGLGQIDVIIDACANHIAVDAAELPPRGFTEGAPDPRREQLVLCAASSGEYARNLNIAQTGMFTRELMDVLQQDPKAGWPPDFVRVADQLRERFKALRAKGGTRQTPNLVWVNASNRETIENPPEEDRRAILFSRLGVFQESFSFLACTAVCPDFRPLEIDIYLRDLLEAGVLSQRDSRPHRYFIDEDAAAAARQRLELLKEYDRIQSRHAQFLLELALTHEPILRSAARRGSMAILEDEAVNIATTLKWCSKTEETLDTGLRLGGALAWFWILNGRFAEGRAQLRPLLGKRNPANFMPGRASALYADGTLAFMEGEYVAARKKLENSAELIRREPGSAHRNCRLAFVLTVLGRVEDDFKEGAKLVNEARLLFKRARDPWGEALALNDLGYVLASCRDWKKARARLNESQSKWSGLNDDWGHSLSLNNYGMVQAHGVGPDAADERGLVEARAAHELALSLYLDVGNDWGVAESLKFLGEVELEDGNFRAAEGCFREALRRLRINRRDQLKVDILLGIALLLVKPQPVETEAAVLATRMSARWRAETLVRQLVPPPHHEEKSTRLKTALIRVLGEDDYLMEREKGRDTPAEELLKQWPPGTPPFPPAKS